jgi:hypothetical protein
MHCSHLPCTRWTSTSGRAIRVLMFRARVLRYRRSVVPQLLRPREECVIPVVVGSRHLHTHPVADIIQMPIKVRGEEEGKIVILCPFAAYIVRGAKRSAPVYRAAPAECRACQQPDATIGLQCEAAFKKALTSFSLGEGKLIRGDPIHEWCQRA